MRKFLFLLLFAFVGYGFAAETIYAWGYGDVLAKALEAIKFTFATNDYAGIFKFALLIGLIMVLLSMIRMGPRADMLAFPKLFFLSFGVSALFVTSKIDVVVYDVSANQNYVVNGVPWAVAKPMVWFSGMEKHIGEIMETTFAVPGDISYSNGGFLRPFGVMDGAANAKIVDPYLFMSLDNFILDCVVPDITGGYYDIMDLSNSENLWGFFSNTNPARVTMYFSEDNKSGTLLSCDNAYKNINNDLNRYVTTTGMSVLGNMLGGYTAVQTASVLGTSSNYFMGYTNSAADFLLQSIMVNQFTDTYQAYAMANGIDARAASYGLGKAEQTAQANMIISGMMGSKYIPVIKGILTVIIASLTPIVALLLLTPMFFKVLSGYLLTMIWLGLWHIGEVILNFIVLVKASNYMHDLSTINGTYTIITKPVVDTSLIDYVNMASSMYWLIPTIAGMIVGGFSWMAFSGMTGGMTAKVSRGEMAAGEVGSASASMGNINMNNASANKQNWTRSSSFGEEMNRYNSYNENYGSNIKDANQFTNSSFMTNNRRLNGSFSGFTGADGTMVLPMGGRGVDEKTGEQVEYGRGTIFDANGKMLSGTETVKDPLTGATIEREYSGGNIIKETSKLAAGLTATTENLGGYATKNFKNAAGNYIDAQWQNGNLTVSGSNVGVEVSKGINRQKIESEMQKVDRAISGAVDKMITGGKLTAEQASFLEAAAFAAATNTNTTDERIKTASKQAIAETTDSVVKKAGSEVYKVFDKVEEITEKETSTKSAGGGIEISGKSPLSKFISVDLGFRYEHAWQDEHGVTVKTQDGKSYRLSFSKDFQSAFKEQFNKSYAENLKEAFGKTDTRTDGQSASGGVTDTSSRSETFSQSEKEAIAKGLTKSYAESVTEDLGITDKNEQNRALTEFINSDVYKDFGMYKGLTGKEAVAAALTDNDPRIVSMFKDFLMNKYNIEAPKEVLPPSDKKTIEGIELKNVNVPGAEAAANKVGTEPVDQTAAKLAKKYSHLVPGAPQNNLGPSITQEYVNNPDDAPKDFNRMERELRAEQDKGVPEGMGNNIFEDPTFKYKDLNNQTASGTNHGSSSQALNQQQASKYLNPILHQDQGQVPVQPVHGQVPGHQPINQGQGQAPGYQGQVPVKPVQGQVPVQYGSTGTGINQGHQPVNHQGQGQVPGYQGQVPVHQGQVPVHQGQVPVQPVHGQVPGHQGKDVIEQQLRALNPGLTSLHYGHQGQVPGHQGQVPVQPVHGQVPVQYGSTGTGINQGHQPVNHQGQGQVPGYQGQVPVHQGQVPVHQGQVPVQPVHGQVPTVEQQVPGYQPINQGQGQTKRQINNHSSNIQNANESQGTQS